MSPWRVKMPTQNLLMLQLLLVRIVLATICCRFWSWCLVKKLLFRLEHKVSSRFWSWSSGKIGSWSLAIFLRWYFVEVMKLNLGRDFEARFVKILLSFMERLMFRWNFEVDAWSRFWRCNLIKIFVWTCDMNSTLGSVVPLAMFLVRTEGALRRPMIRDVPLYQFCSFSTFFKMPLTPPPPPPFVFNVWQIPILTDWEALCTALTSKIGQNKAFSYLT